MTTILDELQFKHSNKTFKQKQNINDNNNNNNNNNNHHHKNITNFRLVAGNILQYKGDAIINAANEGCIGGFGLDEQINKAGGFELKKARRNLGGCQTGHAKITPSFDHLDFVKWIIHAVGPVYRVNRFKVQRMERRDGGGGGGIDGDGSGDGNDKKDHLLSSLDPLLVSAYRASLERAREVGAKSVGFPLLSAGVFRGDRMLDEIVEIGVVTLAHYILNEDEEYNFDEICLFAYTEEEREAIEDAGKKAKKWLESHDDFVDYPLMKGSL